MSKYTTEVRFICESLCGLNESVGFSDVPSVIERARKKIFDFNYPIFDTNYKQTLETKILMHYYTREISEETYGLWKLRLMTKLNEIMPYYNKLYESELIKYNPLWNVDITTDRDVVTDNQFESESVVDSTNKRTGDDTRTLGGQDVSTLGGEDVTTENQNRIHDEWNLFSDTPQGGIGGIEGATDDPTLGDNAYLTNATHNFGNTEGTELESTTEYGRTNTTDYGRVDTLNHNTKDKYDGDTKNDGTSNEVVDYIEKMTGYRDKFPSEAILKFRETFLNIDMMIIKDLRNLFFNLW